MMPFRNIANGLRDEAVEKEQERIMNRIWDLYKEILVKAVSQTVSQTIHPGIEAVNDRFEFLMRERLEAEGFKPTLINWAMNKLAQEIKGLEEGKPKDKDTLPKENLAFYGGKLSNSYVANIWYSLKPKKPMPEILACVVDKTEFFKVMTQHFRYLVKNKADPFKSELWEYGYLSDKEECRGFVIPCDPNGKKFLILIRKDYANFMPEILKHELLHIHREDWKKFKIA